jgi:dihydrolipoamide dehydrogenase
MADRDGDKHEQDNDGGGDDRSELVIVGGGPGGYMAAFAAADLGLDVTLVDPEENPGGVCLYRGCIPSKALLHAAKLVRDAEEGAKIGISFGKPEIDLNRIRAWKNEVVDKLTAGLGGKAKQARIAHLRGHGRLIGENTLAVELVAGGWRTLEFDQAILAAGSRPLALPGVPEESDRVLDSSSALDLASAPKSLLVIGGGYIGLELGSVYAALGSRVSVVEMTGGLLPGVDRDLVSVLKRRLDTQFDEIRLNAKVTDMKQQKNGMRVAIEDKQGGSENRVFERVLVSIGRRPNSDDLGLDAAGIETDERGFVKVDGQRRTAARHIFAIGDLAGEPMLAHKAYAEALVAAEAAAGRKSVYDPRAIPAVVFTDPEIAWCGLTETEARARQRKVKTAKIPWRSNGRTLTLGREDGLTKLIADPENGRLLGVGLAGPGAGELIAEAVLAVEMAAVAEDLRRTIHPHPTLSETLFDAAAGLLA